MLIELLKLIRKRTRLGHKLYDMDVPMKKGWNKTPSLLFNYRALFNAADYFVP